MTCASQLSTVRLRQYWARESQNIAQEYARVHLERGDAALSRKDLKTAISEYEAAGKAENELGEKARTALERVTALRKELEKRLEIAKAQIEKEQWNDCKQSIEYVWSRDISLQPICRTILVQARERHYQAALRDSRAFFARKDLSASFAKINEALALDATRNEACNLKAQIQRAFVESAEIRLKEALEKDMRSALEEMARQFEAFELQSDAARIRTVVANRAEADRLVALAQTHMDAGRQELALDPLQKACSLWPENKKISKSYQEVCRLVGASALAEAEKALNSNCPLVAVMYCLKASHVCPFEQTIHDRVCLITSNALQAFDRNAIMSVYLVEVNVNKEIEMWVNGSHLQNEIMKALISKSPFATVISATENPPNTGAIFRIKADVLTLSASTYVTTFQKEIQYVASVIFEPNPEYAKLQEDLLSAEQKMQTAREGYESAQRLRNQANLYMQMDPKTSSTASFIYGAGAVLGSVGESLYESLASSAYREYRETAIKLSQTPPTIPRNEYATYPYLVREYTRRGKLKAYVQLLNAEGLMVADRVIEDNYGESDIMHEGYLPAGLQADPLTLPSEDDIRARFIRTVYSGAAEAGRTVVYNYWASRWTDASNEKDLVARWERLIRIALQEPLLANYTTRNICQNLSNLPPDFLARISTLLARGHTP